MPFLARGPYCYVRHPLYLFSILPIWSAPRFSTDQLLFNVLWTIWIIVGTRLEERDLLRDFGQTYRECQLSVPMLLPLPRPRANPPPLIASRQDSPKDNNRLLPPPP